MTEINTTALATQNIQATLQKQSTNSIQKGGFKDHLSAQDAAQKFEAMYLGQMFGLMFEHLPSDGYFGGGSGEDIYKSMMATEYGNMVAKNGGLGIADQVYGEILKMQEGVKQ